MFISHRWPRLQAAVLLALLATSKSAFGQETASGPAIQRRLLAEAPAQWASYAARVNRLPSRATLVERTTRNGVLVRSRRASTEMKVMDHCAVWVSASLEPGTDGRVEGVNEKYAFTLRRESAKRGWALVELKTGDGERTWSDTRQKILQGITEGRDSALRIWHLRLPVLLKDSAFRIVAVSVEHRGGVDLARVQFQYPKGQENPKDGVVPLHGGWFLLDPQHYWIVREYEVYSMSPDVYTYRRRIDIKESTTGFPLVTRVSGVSRGTDGKDVWETTTEIDGIDLEPEVLPDTAFTLSAFGLPEPVGVVWDQPSRYSLWFALGGAAALVAGVIFARLARRRAAK